tara:strand:+ start:166 stop:528 length:363 start_codon:yes stop_codon:yes gene_type:complete
MATESNQLHELIIAAVEDRKGINIVTLEVSRLTDITDFMVIASGRSQRQVKSIAQYVTEQAKIAGYPTAGTEGLEYGDWVLLDLYDVIVHIMTPETRDFYQLEKLWSGSGARPTHASLTT